MGKVPKKIQVSDALHRQLKILAVVKECTLQDAAEQMIRLALEERQNEDAVRAARDV